ncbi:RagB/SusD family nutrient uptake outer membrane protein [Ancylomarina salipaludis]|uniref:RagB/SusD family nutrient uptake outer membrane protein n=1 Tax=Ancylomarina salipaludis TaxID=2501299 RepID=A0A4Q1JLW9_9BACT|nr:RagB/SusD family nutrient uptake outer membrane protein [Ancylomarina salipaludis]RXQ93945.1 RagB/SusD family nutrient uptake outer membrane protein [Ancylomarina salipaludis]
MKNKIIILITFVGLLFSACDDYLDVEPKGRKILQNAEEYSALLESDHLFTFPLGDVGYLVDESSVMDERWITEDEFPVLKANFTFNESADRAKFIEQDMLYNNCYKRIAHYNVIINQIDEAEGDDKLKKKVKAQAQILRAFNNFYLINFYAKHYNKDNAAVDRGVILSVNFDMEAILPQSSVQKVYDAIEQDIADALEHLPAQPNNTFRPGKALGYALKAKVHLFKKEFGLALTAAEESLKYNDYLFDLVAYNEQYQVSPYTVQVDYGMQEHNLFRYGFDAINGLFLNIVSPEFVEKFETGDIRLETFFATAPFLPEGTMYYGLIPGSFQQNAGGIRSAEVFLMKAECLARGGKFQDAIDIVNKLREKRFKPESYVALNASNIKEAMDIIIAERAREMYLTPNRYWDLRRLNTEPEYAITLNKTFKGKTYTLKPNSHLYIQPFSIEAITRNPNLEQNSK